MLKMPPITLWAHITMVTSSSNRSHLEYLSELRLPEALVANTACFLATHMQHTHKMSSTSIALIRFRVVSR